jgi:P27 family predicted phage terminase small subunit
MSSGKGRPRKPTAIKKLTVTFRNDRAYPEEPHLGVCFPDKPEWLDSDPLSSQLFDQVSKYMVDMSVSTSVDGLALSMLADQVALYLRLRGKLLEDGEMIHSPNSAGEMIMKAHPSIAPMNQSFVNITRLMREYGLTASSRSSLATRDQPSDINSFEDFLKS